MVISARLESAIDYAKLIWRDSHKRRGKRIYTGMDRLIAWERILSALKTELDESVLGDDKK